VEATLQGGQVVCSYCGANNQIVRRAQHIPAAATELTEAQRYAKLREQDAKPIATPPALTHVAPRGTLDPSNVELAKQEWTKARVEHAGGAGFAASERLYS